MMFSRRVLAAALGVVLASCAAAAPAAEEALPVPESLGSDGLPPIPRSLAEQAAPYLEFRTAVFQDFDPITGGILIATRFGDVQQLHRVRMPGGARTQLTFYPERVLLGRYRPRSGDIVFMKDIGGGEWFQLYSRDGATGRTTRLTDGSSRNTFGAFSKDGSWLAYQSTRRNGKDSDIWIVNPSDPKTDRLLLEVSGGGWQAQDFSPGGRALLVGEYVSVNESRLWLVDVATGKKTLLTPESKEPVSWGGARFSPDGKTVYTTTDLDSEFRRLVALDVATRRADVLTPGLAWDVDDFDLSPDGARVAWVLNEAGIDTIHVLDVAAKKEIPLPKLPAGLVQGLKWDVASKRIGFGFASARSPADVCTIDVAAGHLERWTESETGGLELSGLSEPEAISWTSFDGRTITGFLYRPPARFAGRRPVVVDIHGGPEGEFRPGFLGRDNYLLNEMGVALVFPNVRGSTGFGKTFVKLDNGVKREDAVKDIGALLDWLAARPDLDRTRMMVTGGSYGGYMSLATLVHYGDRLRCGIDVVGISNFVTFLESTESYRRDLRRVEYGDERDPGMREFLNRISPLTNAGRIARPLLVVSGRNDPRVPYTESAQMVAAVRKNGVPVWFLTGKDEGHGFAKKHNRDFQFVTELEFIETYLLP